MRSSDDYREYIYSFKYLIFSLTDTMSTNNSVPDHFICPISLEIMQDPVICSDGNTYEREEIARWFINHDTSPKTNLPLANKNLIPNHAIKAGILKHHSTQPGKTTNTVKTRSATESTPEFKEQKIQIFVRLITNSSISIQIGKHSTVLELMNEVQRIEGIAAKDQRLIFAGKQMDAHQRLSYYGVKKGSVIHLVLRLVGGIATAAV